NGEVPGGHRQVDGLHYDPALPVQDAERVDEVQNVAEGFDVPVAPAVLPIVDVGRACHGTEIDHVAAHVQMPLGIAGVKYEGRRCELQVRSDDVAPEADQLRLFVHQ